MSSIPPEANVPPAAPANIVKSPKFVPVQKLYEKIAAEIGKLFVGQEELVLGSLTALFAGGHVLIESVPGLGKTLFVR
ncbi:MAG: AAA family ATPase, partial [Rubripirellula sp.]